MTSLQRLPVLSLLAAGLFAVSAHAEVVISQVYGGGGNSGAPFTNDFVELFNRGEAPESLSGRSVQYTSSTGTGNFGSSASLLVALPAATLQPGQYFLVKLAGGSTGAALPTADATGSINMSGTAGKVVLAEGTTSLGCNGSSNACSPEQQARIIDLVGFGGANFFETSAAPAPSNTTADLRKAGGCTDSNNNGADFVTGAPNPRNSATALAVCSATPPPPPPPPPPTALEASIHAIQSHGIGSPIAVGTEVVTEGIVTALRSNGYFIQSAIGEEDQDPETAEGVFVFTGSAGAPAGAVVGNRVRVTAKIGSFSRSPNGYPLTQLTGSSLVVRATDQPLPPEVLLGPADLAASNEPSYLGRYQGMRIALPSAKVLNPSNDFGDFYITLPATRRPAREPGIGKLDAVPLPANKSIPRFDLNPERLRVESTGLVGGTRLFLDNGTRIDGLHGVMYYDRGDFTFLLGDNSSLAISGGVAPVAVPATPRGAVRIGSYNIEFFGGGANVPVSRLKKLSEVFCDYLDTPDLVGLIEIADLASLQRLARAINDDEFGYCEHNPQYQAYLLSSNGTQRLGYLVSTANTASGKPRVEVSEVAEVFANERLVAPDGSTSSILFDRAPLRLEGRVNADNGQSWPLTVLLNHPLSLLDVNSLTTRSDSWGNDGNRSRGKRAQQAAKVAQWVEDTQVANPDKPLVLIGDFNAFDFNDGYVDVLGVISGHPAAANDVLLDLPSPVTHPLLNLSGTGSEEQRYSFVFEGNIQSLDHALVNQAVLDTGAVTLHHARVNADFAVDHETDDSVPMRTSDHDPLVAEIRVPQFLDTDLTVSLAGPRGPVFTDQRVAFPLAIGNAGVDDAVETALTLHFDMAVAQFQLIGSGWVCNDPVITTGGSDLACERNDPLPTGAVDALRAEIVTVRPHNAALVTLTASVSSRSTETRADDNAASVAVRVLPARCNLQQPVCMDKTRP